jgi:hypothetical protein
MWTLFAPTGALGKSPQKHVEIVQPNPRLVFPILSNPTCKWLVVLRLEDVTLTAGLLLSVPQLRNVSHITVLCQSYREASFSDRIMRSWAHDASTGNGFSRLETIFVEATDEVTAASLQHLNDFPKLETFCVSFADRTRPRYFDVNRSSGWIDSPRLSSPSQRTERHC